MYDRKYSQMFPRIYHRELGQKPNIIIRKCFCTYIIEVDYTCAETFANIFLLFIYHIYFFNVVNYVYVSTIIFANVLAHVYSIRK